MTTNKLTAVQYNLLRRTAALTGRVPSRTGARKLIELGCVRVADDGQLYITPAGIETWKAEATRRGEMTDSLERVIDLIQVTE